jgi:SAM-dependent methyltransferase
MTVHNTLSEWLETPHGRYLLEREQDLFDQGVADIFGYHAMQLGLPDHDMLRAARIPLRVLAGYDAPAQVLTRPDELPFDTGSLDLVLLPHVLEFSESPHQILRDVERAMMPGGHLLLTGFNPRSLWGLRRWLGRKAGYPWRGKFIALPRIKDWLKLLGLEVVSGRFACYAPPLARPALTNRMRFLEPAGDRWWAVCGGVYFLHAIKQVPGVRPIKPQWNERLVGNLLPVRPKLNRDASPRISRDSQ